ncbi:craniofacial development protein 2 [Biomphalaria glabrata]|nr:craniofacial development protein 2 [Biomphalaria glabrata]
MQSQSLIMLIGYVVDVRERFRTLLEVDLRKPRDDDPVSNGSQLKTMLQDDASKSWDTAVNPTETGLMRTVWKFNSC